MPVSGRVDLLTERWSMTRLVYTLIVGTVFGLFSLTNLDAVSAKAAGGKDQGISAATAVKVAEQYGRIVTLQHHQYAKKVGHYYKVTVVDATENEIKDLFIDAKTGKVMQTIEHPSQEP